MYVIIVGSGRLSRSLAKALLDEEHEVLIIDKDEAKVSAIEEELGSIYLLGDGCEVDVLEEAGTDRADVFIAVTGHDEDNLVACQVAKHKFNVPRTIAQVTDTKNEHLFKMLEVDVTVTSFDIILEHIKREIPIHPLTRLAFFPDTEVEVVELKIPSDAASVNKRIDELSLPSESCVSLIVRSGEDAKIMPSSDFTLQAEDKLVIIARGTQSDLEKNLCDTFTTPEK